MKKYIVFLIFVLLVSMAAVSAHDNQTLTSAGEDANLKAVEIKDNLSQADSDAKLEKTYFYDAGTDEEYVDDTVITHNVVKYYGDKETKFKVKVLDEDHNPQGGVYVSFGEFTTKYKEKTTNSKGIVYFPINYKVGKYYVETYIESEDGSSYWSAENVVKIKSTIPVKELVKYSASKKKFKIKFLDTKGNPLKNTAVKLKIKGKTYKVKTNGKGIVKIKSTRFKVGKEKITAYNPVSGEKRKISVIVLKKGVHKINVKIVDSPTAIESKKLKNGDCIDTVYETKYRQYNPGVYVEATGGGLTLSKHTKLLKAKFYFKNPYTGKVITKTSKKVKYSAIVIKPISGYVPYKATVWYKDKK